jgi:hypothetical protein
MRKIDHIVYTVPNLEEAVAELEARLGVKPLIGGRHDTQGTRNALINLNDGAYLEILAADDENTNIPPPRWMGVDVLSRPRITRWALKSNNLTTDGKVLREHDPALGHTKAGSRQRPDGSMLRWELILPTSVPEVDVIPFMVDWSQSDIHPHEALPDMGCSIIELLLQHPEPERIQPVLQELGVKVPVTKGEEPDIILVLRCPAGNIPI